MSTPSSPVAATPGSSSRFAGSQAYQARAQQVLPRGVSSSPRATQRPVPLAIARGEAAHVIDVDGNEYIDYSLGYGPLLLGHSPEPVLAAAERELRKGLRTGGITPLEAELGERIAKAMPACEMSAFVSSGTEAAQLALRLARAATGRLTVVKFRCHYHGWSDAIHVATDAANDGPSTGGQDPDALRHVVVLDWGDMAALEALDASGVAAVIMEAAAVNAGCFAPAPGYLARVREWTTRHGVALIFDEVITGFRLALGGAQGRFGVAPDLTVLGKALGGGLPVSAVAGRRALFEPIVRGTVSQRGTYNGFPPAIAGAVACLDYLGTHAATLYPRMEAYATTLAAHVRTVAARTGVAVAANQLGPCVQLFAGVSAVPTLRDLARVDKERTLTLTAALVEHGVAPLPRGMMYVSSAHTDADLARTLEALTAAIGRLA
ncbi:MAG: aspartate aminotransferase family protein [Burkholderiales bacterium]|nr:aspartate aminotransferase family protein [Burkholderiales bacterium]